MIDIGGRREWGERTEAGREGPKPRRERKRVNRHWRVLSEGLSHGFDCPGAYCHPFCHEAKAVKRKKYRYRKTPIDSDPERKRKKKREELKELRVLGGNGMARLRSKLK
ncbi:MAG: hypothetical protein LBK99_13365, partial [Opitutaceae bacterium]|nr:hypothetical protein [Opitutaceae bacterium]